MQVALDMGTINIDNKEVANFIRSKNTDELKNLFLNFITNQLDSNSDKSKNKWAEFGTKMSGLISERTVDELNSSSREFRENFEFRDLKNAK